MSFDSDLKQIRLSYKKNKEASEAIKEVLNVVEIHVMKIVEDAKRRAAAKRSSAPLPIPYSKELRADLATLVNPIATAVAVATREGLKDLRAAQENGVSDAEFVDLIVAEYLPPLLEKHSAADAARLESDIRRVTQIALTVATALARAVVDKLIAKEKASITEARA